MTKILIPLIALLTAASAHAIAYDVALSGSLTELQRPSPDTPNLPVLDAWSFEFELDAASEPATFAELLTAMSGSVGDLGVLKIFENGSLFGAKTVEIKQLLAGQFVASEGWTTQSVSNVSTWAWNSEIAETVFDLDLRQNGSTEYIYSGTVGMDVSTKPVPDAGSTAALAGLGLFSVLVIRRKLGTNC